MTRLALLAVVLLVAGIGGVGATEASGGSAALRERAPTGISLTLEQVKEIRQRDYGRDPSGGFGMFDAPGLHLRFAIDAPKGRRIIEVRQPTDLRAVDSTGIDLTKLPPSRFGEPKHVETIREWEEPPHALSLRLALPKRAARSFTVAAKLEALTYIQLREATLEAGPEWSKVPAGLLGDEPHRVRLQRQRGSLHLVIEPGSARESLEKVELLDDGAPLESEGTMWNDRQVAYMFTAPADPGAVVTARSARLAVRQGLGVIPITIELTDEPLP